ncbi:MAG: 50S ribosomal protein L33 [Bacilli bacterium]|nr:50S ribosomal protein L33 [Bacilli bacterium]
MSSGGRINIVLKCSNCGEENYITSKKSRQQNAFERNRFCSKCRIHTKHIEKKKK